MKAKTVGEMRALVAGLEGYADGEPITVYFDSDFGEASGIEILEQLNPNVGLGLSISNFQIGGPDAEG